MDLLVMLIVGGVVGWLASMAMKTNRQMGILANVAVGIVGSSLGFWLAAQLGIFAGGIGRWLVAFVGSVILIAILKALHILR
jgi:uncharacterized membrane protein YeaQ/YmgE (transglycosylase-associated protein family)